MAPALAGGSRKECLIPVTVGLLCTLLFLGLAAAPAQADRAFAPRFTANQPGDITMVGNTVLTCPVGSPPNQSCINAQNGAASSNNNWAMTRVDVDSDPGTTSSSRATLSMPANASVLWAGLYWFGASGATARSTVKFQPPGQAGYTTLTATTLDISGAYYQGFRDVTAAVAAAGSGVYTVADVAANTGNGNHGGWALVVAYGDATQPPRNLSIFDGLVSVSSGTQTITVSGFTTPPTGAVKTTLGVVAGEGDRGTVGDSMSLDGRPISNTANPANNVFNSSISTRGTDPGGRFPNYVNQLGMDIDMFNADGILGNLDRDATIKLTTSGDVYLPGVVTFATELYAPVVVPSKSVQNLKRPTGPTRPGDTLRYTLSFQNTGQDAADAFVVTDPIPVGATYKPGTLAITAGPNAPATPSDAADADLAEFDPGRGEVRFRLGTGASGTSGGTLAQGATVTASFDVTIDADHREGDVIVNRGSSDYRGRTVGTAFNDQLTPETRTVVHAPDLTLSKTHSPAFVAGGDTTFTLIASNVGGAPTDGSPVTVTDTFPGGASGFDSISNAGGQGWNCQVSGLDLTCTRTDVLPHGASYPPILVDARLHDPIAPSIVNTAFVDGGGDTNDANNGATDTGGATSLADLVVTKRTATPSLSSGGTVEWVVDVHNAGPSTASAVTLADPLPAADYADVTASTTQGTCDTSVSCDLGSIVRGGTATVTIRARVLANDTTLTNTASATSATGDPDPGDNEDDADLAVVNTADMSIVKTGGPPNPVVGSPYTYTLAVRNDGPGTATDLVVTDQLPAALEAPTVVAGPGWSCNSPGTGGLLTCTRATLAVGAAPDITISGTIGNSAGGAFFSNSAAVDTGSEDPRQGNNTSDTTELATPAADLAVTKTFNAGNVVPGDTVTVDLIVTNNGPNAATNVRLTDSFPANLDVTGTDNAACTVTGGSDVACAFPALAPGASLSVTVTVVVGGPGDETLENFAAVASDTGDPIESNDTDRDTLTVVPAADVSITKVADPASAAVGDQVTYTLVASNGGPSTANGVSVIDELPPGMSFVSASAGCVPGSGMVTCTPAGGSLASGASATFTVTVAITAQGAGRQVGNTARITTTTPHDPDPSNNETTSSVGVDPRADLALEKTAADDTPAVDADNTFTLTVTNNGENTAENVTIEDPVPTGMTFVAAEQGCRLHGTTVRCDIGSLGNGQSASRTVTLRAGPALAGQPLTNSASVTTTTADPVPANNDDSVGVTVGERVDLALQKSVTPGSVVAGDSATYTLVVTNDGPSAATGVTLSDPLPEGLQIDGIVPSQGSCSPPSSSALECELGTIAAGAAAQVLLTVRPADSAVGQTLENTATVDSDQPEARPGDNTDSATLAVTQRPPSPPQPAPQQADLHVTKTVSSRTTRVGRALHYRITVENRGTGTARDVVATDTFSGPVDVVRVTPSQGSCSGESPITCRLGDVAAGGTATIEITARPRNTGRLSNSATATSPDDRDPAGDLVGETETRVRPAPASLALRKRASARRIAAGQAVAFTLTLRSRGPGPALNVRICDPLPRGLQFVSAPGARFRGGKACWTFARLRDGAVRRLRLVARGARLPATRTVRNVARARATGVRPTTSRASVRVLAAPGRGGGVTG